MSGRPIMDDLELLLGVMPPAIRQAIEAGTDGEALGVAGRVDLVPGAPLRPPCPVSKVMGSCGGAGSPKSVVRLT